MIWAGVGWGSGGSEGSVSQFKFTDKMGILGGGLDNFAAVCQQAPGGKFYKQRGVSPNNKRKWVSVVRWSKSETVNVSGKQGPSATNYTEVNAP